MAVVQFTIETGLGQRLPSVVRRCETKIKNAKLAIKHDDNSDDELKSQLFLVDFFLCLKPIADEGGEETWVPREDLQQQARGTKSTY